MTRRYESGEGGVVGCVMGVDLLDWANTRTLGWCWVWFFLPLEARRSLFPDWPRLCDESLPVTTQKGSARSFSNFGEKIQNGVHANS